MRQRSEAGFTLIEMMIATVVCRRDIGLAATLADGLAYMDMSKYDYIAQQRRARQWNPYSPRATWARRPGPRSATWVPHGCIFLSGPRQLCDPGADGILGTADDNCAGLPDAIVLPGPDGKFSDAVRVPLSNFTRTITITPINANLVSDSGGCHLLKRTMDRAQAHLTTNMSNFS